MVIKRQVQTCIGRGSTYIKVNGSKRRSWESSIIDYTKAVQECKRKTHRRHPTRNSSLLVIKQAAEKRFGNSCLELKALGSCGNRDSATAKQTLISIASNLKLMLGLSKAKCWQPWSYGDRRFLEQNTAFLICDEAQRMQVQLRCWLERLYNQEQPLLLFATFPPARDILKLPRIELQPFQIALSGNYEGGSRRNRARLIHRPSCAPTATLWRKPNVARRAVNEEYLGLEDQARTMTSG